MAETGRSFVVGTCCCIPDDTGTGTGTGTIPPPVTVSCCPVAVPRTLCFQMRNISSSCTPFDWTGFLNYSVPPPGPPAIFQPLWWACKSVANEELGYPPGQSAVSLGIRMFCYQSSPGVYSWGINTFLTYDLFASGPCAPNVNTNIMLYDQTDPVVTCDPFCAYTKYSNLRETGILSVPCLANPGVFDGSQIELSIYDCNYGPCFPDTGTGTITGWYCWMCSGGIVPACNQSSTVPPFEGCTFVGGPYATEEECFASCGSGPAPSPAMRETWFVWQHAESGNLICSQVRPKGFLDDPCAGPYPSCDECVRYFSE